MKVGFVTSTGYPELTPDDRLAADALRDQGLEVEPVIWTDSGDRWRVLDGLVVRSPWDYHLAPDRFLSWIDRVQATGLPLWNPPGILRWNLNKGYLRTVEAWGFPIPPTRWIGRGSATPLVEHLMALGTDEAVIKPVVGASARGVIRVTRASLADGEAHLRQILGSGDAMVQAFAPEVESAGEWSLVFLGGEFSHAVVKTPRAGDFRVQHEWGGSHARGEPPPGVVDQAMRLVGRLGGPVLYARVDGYLRKGVLTVMELELLEPLLFLAADPGAPARFAEAIRQVLVGPGPSGYTLAP